MAFPQINGSTIDVIFMRMPHVFSIILSDLIYLNPETSTQSIRTGNNKAGEMRTLKNRKELGCHVTFLNQSLWMPDLDILKKWSELSFGKFPQTRMKPWDIPQGQRWLRNIRWLTGDPLWRARIDAYTPFSVTFTERVYPWELRCYIYLLKLHFPFCEITLPRFQMLFRHDATKARDSSRFRK